MTTQENFQPQVRDTTNGSNVHTYIPRSDGSIVIGGVAYVPQSGVPAAATAVPAAAIPAVSGPYSAATHIIPPGGPAIPVASVPAAFSYYSFVPSFFNVGYSYARTSYYSPFPASAL